MRSIERPSAAGRLVALRGVLPSDFEWLYASAVAPDSGVTWRFRGMTPSHEAFSRSLWDNCFCQYVVYTTVQPTPVGLVGLYNANLASGLAYLHVLAAEPSQGTGMALAGAALLLDRAFDLWRLRKVCLELPEYNESLIGHETLGRRAVLEARLPEHEYLWGRFWSLGVWAIYGEEWSREPEIDPQRTSQPKPVVPSAEGLLSVVRATVDRNDVEIDTALASCLADSLAVIELVNAVEIHFGLEIDPAEILELDSVASLLSLLGGKAIATDRSLIE